MGKKRKSVATSIDEVDRSMYTTFCAAANSLSQLYTHSMNHHKLSFQAGERHALEKLYQWILRQQEGGSRVTTPDVVNYLQTELDYYGEEASMSPRTPVPIQHEMHFINPVPLPSSGSAGVPAMGQGLRSETTDQQQSKNSFFSNALSSPVRLSLQNYHISEGGYFSNSIVPSANATRHSEPNSNQNQIQNRESNSFNSHDSNMDMHEDSPS